MSLRTMTFILDNAAPTQLTLLQNPEIEEFSLIRIKGASRRFYETLRQYSDVARLHTRRTTIFTSTVSKELEAELPWQLLQASSLPEILQGDVDDCFGGILGNIFVSFPENMDPRAGALIELRLTDQTQPFWSDRLLRPVMHLPAPS